MITQIELKEFEKDVQKSIEDNGGIGFIDISSLATMPIPFALHVLELIKDGKVKLVLPGSSEIF
jgi:hypothetical protein